jgi:hypothetical protein
MNNLSYLMIAGCCVCATLSLPRSILAAPPPAVSEPATEPRTVRLELDVEDLGDKGIGLDQTVREQLSPPLRQANFELVTTTDVEVEAEVTLLIRFRALESGVYDYGVHFEFIDAGGSEPAIEWVDCHMCVDARLMPMLEEQTPALLAALAARVAEPSHVPAPVRVRERVAVRDDAATEVVEGEDIADAGPEPTPITGLGIGGSVVAGLGVGALIWGGVELSRGVVVGDTRGLHIISVDHRPAGYALVVSGTTALVGGVISLAVDLARQAKRRDQARVGHARFYPLLTPSRAGFGVTGEF